MNNDESKVKCKFCYRILRAKRSILLQHAKSKSHNDVAKALSRQSFMRKEDYSVSSSHKASVSNVEVRSALFVALHATFRSTDHLTSCMKEAFPDSKIVNDVKIGNYYNFFT